MACACAKRKRPKYLWFKGEADKPVVYNSDIEAKAKVIRKGGMFIVYDPNVPIGTQVNAAMAARNAAG